MGGAFVTVTGKTPEELDKERNKKIEDAKKMGLLDVRAISEIRWDEKNQEWTQTFWVHS